MDLVIYVDESGTHDNRYLVITALVTKDMVTRKRFKRCVGRCYVKFQQKCTHGELHASQLNFQEKQHCATKISSLAGYELFYLVADKKHTQKELLSRPNLYYNYLFSHLFKRVLSDYSNKQIHVICDNREVAAQSKNSLPEYVQAEAYANWGFMGKLRIDFLDSRDAKGLQAVDLVANAIYSKYNLKKDHLYRIYTNGSTRTVGIKFPHRTFGT